MSNQPGQASHNPDDWPDQSEMVHHMPYLEEMASKCPVILEIGCGHGNGSTRAFVRGMNRPGGSYRKWLISVDLNPDNPECEPVFEPVFERPGPQTWWKVTGDSREPVVRDMVRNILSGRTPDLIYIDTEHSYEQLARELEVWSPLADSGTIWLFHDTFMFGAYNHMTDAIIDFCAAHPEWEYVEITKESHGMGMMRWKAGQTDAAA